MIYASFKSTISSQLFIIVITCMTFKNGIKLNLHIFKIMISNSMQRYVDQ